MPRSLIAPWHIFERSMVMEYIQVTKENIEKEHICYLDYTCYAILEMFTDVSASIFITYRV